MRISIVFVFFTQFGIILCEGQANHATFKRFTHDQGLSLNFITCVNQDKQGFMWIGTHDGLNKYDGYTFTVYQNNPEVKGSISNNSIAAIYVDKKGILYIGTEHGGLNIYESGTDTFTTYLHNAGTSKSNSADHITSILEDNKGVLWIGTHNGLSIFDRHTKTFHNYKHDANDSNSLPNNVIQSLVESKNGSLWIGTDNGISVLSPDRKIFKHYRHTDGNAKSISVNAIRSIFIDHNDEVWIGTGFGGLNYFDKTTETFTRYQQDNSKPNRLLGDYILGMCEDKDYNLWITTNFGLSVLNRKTQTFQNYQNDPFDEHTLVDNGLNTIFCDREGNLWIGSMAGLCMKEFLPAKFEHIFKNLGKPSSLGSKEVFCFYQDRKERIWIGLRAGFDLYDRRTNTCKHYLNFPDGQAIPSITSIYEDKYGVFWFGMYEGVARYDLEKEVCSVFTQTDPLDPASKKIKDVWYTQEDAAGNLYVSSFTKSIFRYDRNANRFIPFTYQDKNIKDIDPTCFYIDKQNNFWIGSGENGLIRVNPERGTYKEFKNDPDDSKSISNNYILAIYEDKKGNFWIGTRGGLNRLDSKTDTFTSFRESNGLPNGQINAIEEDNNGRLWLSTNQGICCFNVEKEVFKNFDRDDGLQNNEFWHRASCKLHTGELLFGGVNGFNIVNPDRIPFNLNVPPVYLTNFQLFNKPVSIGAADSLLRQSISHTRSLKLSYKESVFSFEFVALNFVESKKNQYAYRMEGFDEDWNEVGTERKATYTNLDPGEYTFRVKASNNDGLWNEEGTSIQIIITPPFWKTWWFKATCVFFIFGTIYLIYKTKTHQIQKRNRELETRVAERTLQIEQQKLEITENRDALKQLNLEISNQNEVLENRVEERTRDLQSTNEELAANEEELRQTLDHALEINDKLILSQVSLAEAQRIARLGSWEIEIKSQHFTWSDETFRILDWPDQSELPSYSDVMKIILPVYHAALKRAILEALQERKPYELAVQFRTKSNNLRWAYIIGKPSAIDTNSRVYKLVGVVIDITEQKLAEEKLKEQNQELRKINTELDRFVYRASHDLRAPLSSLLGLINIAKTESSEEMRMTYLDMMNKSIVKLDTFIQSIIHYSKNARLEITAEPVDFNSIFKETLDTLKYMEGSNTIEKDIAVQHNTLFYSDAFRLKIIFNNIISNAIRYSNSNVASFIHIRVLIMEENATLEFEDNGCGIPSNSIEKVFEMFYRASEKNVGSGLGLYIVKEVVQALNGSIYITSVLGEGTTFKIVLPNQKIIQERPLAVQA